MQYFLYSSVMFILSICFCFLTKKEVPIKEKFNYNKGNIPSYKRIDRKVFVRILSIVIIILTTYFYFVSRYVGKIDGVAIGGIDALVYKDRFLNATGNIFEALKGQSNEYGYGLLVYFVRLFTSDFNVFLAVYYSIMLLLIINFLKRIKSSAFIFFCIVLFITIPMFTSINLMRNVLAYFLVANAAIYMIEKKQFRAFIFFGLAVSCHVSAVIFALIAIVYYILQHNKLKFSVCMTLLFCGILFGFLGIYLLEYLMKDTKYSIYFGTGAISITAIIISFVMLFFIWWRYKKVLSTRNGNLGFAFILTNIFVLFMQFKLAIIYRLFIFSGIGVMLLAGEMKQVFRKKETKYEYITLVFFFAIYMIINLISHYQSVIPSYGLLPWRSIFGGV